MKRILIFLLAVVGLQQANAQTNIYNPDADDDGFISTEDLLMFLTFFESDFTPNPCNCGCYANPFYEPFEVQDTITAYEVASNLFNSQPDSIRLDFVISPFGVGSIPFSDADTLYYDTLTFSQTYPLLWTELGSNSISGNYFGDFVAYQYFRNSVNGYNVNDIRRLPIWENFLRGGLDVVDTQHPNYNRSIPTPFHVEAKSICPNLNNDEHWLVHEDSTFIQVSEGQYINLTQGASLNVPSNDSEYPTWTMYYPLDWLVITEIHNTPEGTE